MRNAFSVPEMLASVPVPVTAPRPKKPLTAAPLVGVHLHVLPASEACVVLAVLAPVSVSVAVAGAQERVPCSPVRVVAFVQSLAMLAAKVPVPSFSLRTIEPDAVAVLPAKL